MDNSYELQPATFSMSVRAGGVAEAWVSVGVRPDLPSAESGKESKDTPTLSSMDLNCLRVFRKVMQNPLEAGIKGNSGKSTLTAVGCKSIINFDSNVVNYPKLN